MLFHVQAIGKPGAADCTLGSHASDTLHDRLTDAFGAAGRREVMAFGRHRTHSMPWREIALNGGFLLFDNPLYV